MSVRNGKEFMAQFISQYNNINMYDADNLICCGSDIIRKCGFYAQEISA
jgi:hypothetical protein